MGVNTGDMDTYSCRNGVAIVLSYNYTVYPKITTQCIRCGWYIGRVKDIYLKYQASGDQYLGRGASSIDQIPSFCMLNKFT